MSDISKPNYIPIIIAAIGLLLAFIFPQYMGTIIIILIILLLILLFILS